MTTNLTEVGWTDENGSLLGKWTNQIDVVNDDTAINVAPDLTVNTLNGDDLINCDSPTEGILIGDRARLYTDNGNDTISGNGFIGVRLSNDAVIDTGNGDDTISGTGFDGFFLQRGSSINTGNGNDTIDALTGGFSNSDGSGRIYLGDGDDLIRGYGYQ
jgi:hypothetical protein